MIKESMLFLYFGGTCGDALAFYRDVLGAEIIERTTYGEADMTNNDAVKDLVMNATFKLGGMTFCSSDVLDGVPTAGDALSIWLEFDSEASLREVYARLGQGDCQVLSEAEETFWNSLYAKVRDPFGVIWELNHQRQ